MNSDELAGRIGVDGIHLAQDEARALIEIVKHDEMVNEAVRLKLVQCAYCGQYGQRIDMAYHIANCDRRPEREIVNALSALVRCAEEAAGVIDAEYPNTAAELRAAAAAARVKGL